MHCVCMYLGNPSHIGPNLLHLCTYHRDVVGKSGRATNAGACRVLALGCDNRRFPSAVSRFCEVLPKLAETKDKAPEPPALKSWFGDKG